MTNDREEFYRLHTDIDPEKEFDVGQGVTSSADEVYAWYLKKQEELKKELEKKSNNVLKGLFVELERLNHTESVIHVDSSPQIGDLMDERGIEKFNYASRKLNELNGFIGRRLKEIKDRYLNSLK